MEFGYKNPSKYLLQFKEDDRITHKVIEAGSEKHAERKLRNTNKKAEEKILVTNIKSNGEFGNQGHGELPNAGVLP